MVLLFLSKYLKILIPKRTEGDANCYTDNWLQASSIQIRDSQRCQWHHQAIKVNNNINPFSSIFLDMKK